MFKNILALLTILSVSGCSKQELYKTGQAYSVNQCINMPQEMQQDCLRKNKMEYQDYKQETDKLK